MSETTAVSQQSKLVEIEKNERLSESMEELCVVCFKDLEIFSIGDCDHPVCFECSTRMRVLCGQNECPICRQSLSKVIFTDQKRTYKDLEINNRSEYYSKKYKIAFANSAIQKAFYTLLEHPCKICNCQPFHTFNALKDHMRREHELFYCDICTEHLKIFSFERKCYTRPELGMHRRKGDPSSAHRGHPICEYCDCRYLDRDELFRHLRRDHFFCHFCDADGSNQFYGDYDSLREHFRNEHYLCEEGECADEQFTGVFRSDIDLRAHIANVHGKCFNKLQAKQARTLQLEITLGRRGRSEHPGANLRSRNENGHHQLDNNFDQHFPQQQPQRLIDAKNEQEFPSLAGTAASSTTNALVNHSNMLRRSTQSGLARTKENFPALGSANNFDSGGESGFRQNNSNGISASAILKHKNNNMEKPKGQHTANSMVIHVSNRPITTPVQTKNDFPALPLKAQKKAKINEDLLLSPRIDGLDKMSTKHRSLVEEYVSVASPTTSKIALIQEEQKETQNKNKQNSSIKLKQSDFPALGPTGPSTSQPIWTKPKEPKKSKVALAPNLKIFEQHKTNERLLPNKYHNHSESTINKTNNKKGTNKNENSIKSTKSNDKLSLKNTKQKNSENNATVKPFGLDEDLPSSSRIDGLDKLSAKHRSLVEDYVSVASPTTSKIALIQEEQKENQNKNKQNSSIKLKQSDFPALGSSTEIKSTKNDINNKISNDITPPPGFISASPSFNKVPPGFQKIKLNSIAKPVNNLTFESSLGAKYSVIPSYTYIAPPNNIERNKELISHFILALNNCTDAVKEFKLISQKFREGIYKPVAYYEHCQAALGDKFDDIFPELLALLPDITKQQELYLVHMQNLNASKKKPQEYQKLEVCSICKQVVKYLDFDGHGKLHNLDLNFPSLGKK